MKNVRMGCFETNSSSQHCIVVRKESYINEKQNRNDYISRESNKLEFWNSDDLYFGRYPFRILCDFKSKLAYAIASLIGYGIGYDCMELSESQTDIYNQLNEITKEYYGDTCDGFIPPQSMVDGYVDKNDDNFIIKRKYVDLGSRSGADDKVEYNYTIPAEESEDGVEKSGVCYFCRFLQDDFGCVDHQSGGLLERFLKKYNVSLKDFLFDHKYLVVIDGDEYCTWEKYKNEKIIDVSQIDFEFPDGVPFN